ncbi:hypothetical protein BDW60DRAFT_190588 [Aspergillus nidulans var. acristatus]
MRAGNRGNPPVRPSLFWEEPASSLHARSQGFPLFLSAWTGASPAWELTCSSA